MTTFNFRIIAVGLLLVVTQQVIFSRVEIFSVHPDVLLLFAMCVAITGGADRGAIAGFAAGLATDLFLVTPLGISALAYAITAYIIGSMSDDANGLAWVVSMFSFAGSALGVLLVLLVGGLSSDLSVSLARSVQVALVVAALNGIAAPAGVRLLRDVWSSRREAAW